MTGEPPANSRAAAKAVRRQSLIEATITVIATHGLSGTTMERVAKFAGTSIGLANFHFESKERLLEAVLQYLVDEERMIWRANTNDVSKPPAERLLAIVDSWFDVRVCNNRKAAVWFSFYADAGAREIYRRVMSELDDERVEATRQVIVAMDDKWQSRRFDPEEIALALEASYDGFWLQMLLYPEWYDRLDIKRKSHNLVAMLFPEHYPILKTAYQEAKS